MNEKLSGSKKYILVIADCYYGRMHAGRFAVKNLFDKNSTLILLQTYQPPKQRKEMSRGISPLLKKIAERELREFKARLLSEFDLPTSKVQIMVREGDLKEIIDEDFSALSRLSIVIGSINESNSTKIPCWNVISSLMEASVRPVFLITKCISVIEKSRILVITGKQETGTENYLCFMEELKDKFNFDLEIIRPDDSRKIAMDKNSAEHFSIHSEREPGYLSPSEQVFYDRVISVSPLKG
ncbi:MAG: hypothetical protein ACOCUP_01345 [bacterium]